jgi:RNA-binding protein 5/10
MPLPEESRSAPKRKFAKAPTPPPPKPAPGPAPGEDISNKGNQLLKKMGWTEGTGLGLEGEGRQAPVPTLLFAEKAGIGASKGKDATKYQGFEGYGMYAKDSVCAIQARTARFC